MKSRVVVSKALGLLTVFLVLACGDGNEPAPTQPLRVPGAPSGVTATPGDASATVSWTAPTDNGGSDILEYVVRASRVGTTETSQRSSSSSLTVTGLVNGEAYTFTVTAINAVGESLPSATSAAIVPRVVPGAPRNVTAMPGDRQATVTWEAPTDNGMVITGYTVRVHEGDTLVATQPASGLSTTVSNLVNGTSYLVTVAASNSVVPGPTADPVAVTPRTVPGAPVVSGSYQLLVGTTDLVPLTLRWSTPDTGGSPISGYVVVVKVGDEVVHTEETTATSVAFSKLNNGTTYTATVMARNIAGDGSPSSPYVEQLCGIASPPRSVVATPADGQMTLTWRPPSELSGCPVLHYRVFIDGASDFRSLTSNEQRITVTGLVNKQSYRFVIDAYNGVAHGESATSFATPYTTPLAPPNFQATPEDGAVMLRWSAPDDRGSNLFRYTVTVTPGTQSPISVDWTVTSLRVSGLANGTPYTFTLVANSNAGDSAPSTAEATPLAP